MLLSKSQHQTIASDKHVNIESIIMSQKYKNFSKGQGFPRTSDTTSVLPPGVKRMGYLRKLKKMKKRFFVLHAQSNYGIARLEYYSSEKKWKFGCEPRRCIDLKSCLNISRKIHAKQKNVIALYTNDDCFAVVADTSEEMEDWLKDLVEVYKNSVELDESLKNRIVYEHLWQVIVDKHELEYDKLLAGPYRVALTHKSLFLIKTSLLGGDCGYLEFPLMSIRRCGHTKDHFFIELGRSAVTGAGEIYMATEATIVAQNMHETVLSAMKSSKTREDPFPRPRSASSSENSNPVSNNRPVGVVAPQTVLSNACSGFSNSRERCDSLPTRPQTIGGNSFNFGFSSVSPTYTSNSNISRESNSRPHSMYEWPITNSPSVTNSIFSPNSLSGYGSSTEEINSIGTLSLNYQGNLLVCENNSLSVRLTTETKEDYLKMSPGIETDPFDYKSLKTPVEISGVRSDYVDMKPNTTSETGSLKKTSTGYMPMAPGGASEEKSSVLQAGYMDMSPTNSLPNSLSNSNLLENPSFTQHEQNTAAVKPYELEKVLSLLHVEEKNIKLVDWETKPSTINETNCKTTTLCKIPSKPYIENVPLCSVKKIYKKEKALELQPPLPERNNSTINTGPPLPPRRVIEQRDSNTGRKTELLISHMPLWRSNLANFYNESLPVDAVGYGSSQNTNLNVNIYCSERDMSDTISISSNKSDRELNEKIEQNKGKIISQNTNISDVNENKKLFSSDNAACDNIDFQHNCDAIACCSNFHSEQSGDYVNINFDRKDSSSSKSFIPDTFIQKNSPSSLAPPFSSDHNYSNIQFGKPTKPICPLPNPVLVSSENMRPIPALMSKPDDKSLQTVLKSPVSSNSATPRNIFNPAIRNIPNSLPAFRKQMSAPAGPLSLRPELPSPGRKSSCPVTMSSGMVKPGVPPTYVNPMHLKSHGTAAAHLKVAISTKSPEHGSVSSASSASDEISSTHCGPRTLSGTCQNFSAINHQTISKNNAYENVVIPERPSTSSRPPSVSSDKELNYASLDLGPSSKEIQRSPTMLQYSKPDKSNDEEPLTYAEIDFTKSEGLKNVSGSIRDGRL